MQTIRYAQARLVRVNPSAPKGARIRDIQYRWEFSPEGNVLVRKAGAIRL